MGEPVVCGGTGRELIRARDVRLRYPNGTLALDRFDLDIGAGEVTVLLGPNGAGKSTAFKVLLGLLPATGGSLAHPRGAVRFGYAPEVPALEPSCPIRDQLIYWARVSGSDRLEAVAKAEDALTGVDLRDFGALRPRAASKGQRQRMNLARSIVTSPSVLFVDEPTSGLDPRARIRLRKLLAGFKRDGMSMVLATHDLEEAASLGDQVVAVEAGRQVKAWSRPSRGDLEDWFRGDANGR